MGHVYAVQRGEGGPIKVGFSKQPEARIKQLATQCPEELRLLFRIEGSMFMERDLHALLKRDRIRGEWYEPTEYVLDYVALFARAGARERVA